MDFMNSRRRDEISNTSSWSRNPVSVSWGRVSFQRNFRSLHSMMGGTSPRSSSHPHHCSQKIIYQISTSEAMVKSTRILPTHKISIWNLSFSLFHVENVNWKNLLQIWIVSLVWIKITQGIPKRNLAEFLISPELRVCEKISSNIFNTWF